MGKKLNLSTEKRLSQNSCNTTLHCIIGKFVCTTDFDKLWISQDKHVNY